jgi:hypothetical protein
VSGHSQARAAQAKKAGNQRSVARNRKRKSQVLQFMTKHCGHSQKEARDVLEVLIKANGWGFDKVYEVIKWRRQNKAEFEMKLHGFYKQMVNAHKEYSEAPRYSQAALRMLADIEESNENGNGGGDDGNGGGGDGNGGGGDGNGGGGDGNGGGGDGRSRQ